jgi:hypothetical protein
MCNRYATWAIMPDLDGVDVYPVGALAAWQHRRIRLHPLRQERRYLLHQLRQHNWRAIRNHFNGYLAEVDSPPWLITRCGHGWTKQRAINDLIRHMTENR